MDLSREAIEQTLRETWTTVRSKVESGTSVIRDSIGSLPFLASVEASVQHDAVPRDEMHISLVPTPFVASGYAIYTARRLPEGAAAANDLPKLRVFHLPGEGAEEQLIQLVLGEAASARPMSGDEQDAEAGAPVADRLHRVAEEIGRHERIVTGGILLVGGVVAVANPLLGVWVIEA